MGEGVYAGECEWMAWGGVIFCYLSSAQLVRLKNNEYFLGMVPR